MKTTPPHGSGSAPGARAHKRGSLWRNSKFLAIFLAGALLLGGGTLWALSGEQQANAADGTIDGTLDYVALGDSYASGHGASDTYNQTECRRSDSAYANSFFEQYKAFLQPSKSSSMFNRACTGSVIQDVVDDQIGPVTGSVEMVTLTIGGNDLDFAGAATVCTLSSSADCAGRLNNISPKINTLRKPLTDLLALVRERAPVANIVITGYPLIFATGDCGALSISEDNRDQMRSLQGSMNTLIREVAEASERVQYADPDKFFDTHRVCDTGERWINQVSDGIAKLDAGASYHPNANGQQAMSDAVMNAATGLTPPS